ncbi:hypothetical protein Tco_0210090 [Tanacetum coccineum]
MTTLQFADTHNLVAFLAKPAKSEGFEQIVDFLNANPIRYALTINPTIYTPCIEQLWATVKVKTVNREVQLQAPVDGKKIIVTEASKLIFYKAFFSPQWKFLIHTILQCLSAKTTAWNEFSSTMASAIICLATSQKFNFSKYIFESMVKNLENVSRKFLMYPRFVQVFFEKQLEGMQSHKRIYVTPSHTKKIFRNMRRVGKGFSGRDTPLFPTMIVHAQQEQGKGSAMPTDPQHRPTIIQPSTSQPQLKQRSRRPNRKDTEIPQSSGPTSNIADEAINKEMDDSLARAATTATGLDVDSGGGPRHQETMRDTIAQTGFENVSKTSNDSLLVGVNTPRKYKDCSSLGDYKFEIESQEVREERRVQELTSCEDYTVEITLVDETQGRYGDEEIFDTGVHDGDEVLAELEVTVKDVNLSIDEITLAQALAAFKSAKVEEKANVVEEPTVSTRPKAKGLVIHEEDQATTPTVSSQQPSHVKAQDKGKGIMVEEPIKMKKKDQISLDEELAFKLQAEEKEEERLAREKS